MPVNYDALVTPTKRDLYSGLVTGVDQVALDAAHAKAAAGTTLGNSWRAAGYGERAGELAFDADKAEAAGNLPVARGLRQQMQFEQAMSSAANPDVPKFQDIRGSGDAAKYLGGTVSQAGHSMLPVIGGGLGGAATGAAIGSIVPGVGTALGGTIGGLVGAFAPSYDMMANESAADNASDPTTMATTTADQRLMTNRAVGAVGGALDMIVPGKVISTVAKPFIKTVAKEGVKDAVKALSGRQLATHALADMGQESVTETAQEKTKQIGQSYLNPNRDTSQDTSNLIESAAGGFFGTAPIAGAHAGIKAFHQRGITENIKPADEAGGSGDLPLSAKIGGKAGEVAASMEERLARFAAPIDSDPRFKLMNTPVDPTADAQTINADADSKIQAASSLAEHIFSNSTSSPAEMETAAKFMSAAQSGGDMDAAFTEFNTSLGTQRTQNEAKHGFFQAAKDFITGTQRRGNAQTPSGAASETTDGGVKDQLVNLFGEKYKKAFEEKGLIFGKDEAAKISAHALFDWAQNGFHNFDKVSRAVVQMWGPDSASMVQDAYDYSVSEGLIKKDPAGAERMKQVVAKLSAITKGGESRLSEIKALVRPTVQKTMTIPELKQLSAVLDAYASGHIKISNKDFRARLEEVFGANADEAISKYEKAPDELLMDHQPAHEVALSSDDNVDTTNWYSGIQESEATLKYHGNGDRVGFDTRYDNAKKNMANLKGKLQGEGANVYEIGAWSKMKKELADSPEALKVQEDELVNSLVGDIGEFAAAHGISVDKARASILEGSNKTVKYLAEQQHKDKQGVDMTPQHVKALEAKGNPNTDFGTIAKGRLILEKNVDSSEVESTDLDTGEVVMKKKPVAWMTSVGQIIQHMRKVRDEGGVSKTDKDGGGAQNYNLLMAGISSLMNTGEFTGRLGYRAKAGAPVTWLKKGHQLPSALHDPHTGMTIGDMKADRNQSSSKRVKATDVIEPSDFQDMSESELEDFIANKQKQLKWSSNKSDVREAITQTEAYLNGSITNVDDGQSDRGFVNADNRPNVTPSETQKIAPIQRDSHGNSLSMEPDPRRIFDSMDVTADKVPEVKSDMAHSSDEVNASIAKKYPDANVRQPSGIQRRMIRKALDALEARGMGQLIKGVSNFAVYDKTIMTGVAAKILPKFKTIAFLSKGFSSFNPKYDSSQPARLMRIVATELARLADAGGKYSGDPAFEVSILGEKGTERIMVKGEVAKELAEAATKAGHFEAILLDGVFKNRLILGDPKRVQRELFAHAVSSYFIDPSEMKRDMPETFNHLETLYGHYQVEGEALPDGGHEPKAHEHADAGTQGHSEAAGERGDNDRSGGSNGPTSERPGAVLGNDNGGLGRSLEAYLPMAEAKNKPLANAIKAALKEIAAGKDFKTHAGALARAEKQFGKLDETKAEPKGNAQTPNAEAIPTSDLPPEHQAVRDEMVKTLGDKIKLSFAKLLQGPNGEAWSGEWTEGAIRIAINAVDATGVARHEAMHQLFSWLRQAKAEGVEDLLKNVAMNPLINGQLRRLLKDHPDAIKQVTTDPEEAAAYLYQFWKAGLIKLGPKSETLLGKIVNFLREITGLVTEQMRNEQHAEKVLNAFSDGKFAKEPSVFAQVMESEYAAERGKQAGLVMDTLGKSKLVKEAVFTAGSVLHNTGNPHLIKLAEMFYTREGDKAGNKLGLFEATASQRAVWLNKLSTILRGKDKEDMPAVLNHLQSRTELEDIADPVVQGLVKDIRSYFDAMHNYLNDKGVKRFDDVTKGWVDVGKVKHNYFPVIWSTDKLAENSAPFIEKLKEHHMAELQSMVDAANADAPEGTPARTVDDVANAIVARIISTAGNPDVTESESSLGITPFSRSINKRSLTWIDHSKFTEFMSDDLASTLTNYTVQMVKRAEYVNIFGNEGEAIQDLVDDAFIHELTGGNKGKVADIYDKFDEMEKEWSKTKANLPESNPTYPTVRMAAEALHGMDEITKAAKKMETPINAVMAMEGTLGREIDKNLQKVFGALTVYQNIRLLALSLFSSFVDPLGMVVRGGTMSDAYEGFKRGLKEIGKQVKGDYTADEMTLLAERLGTVDAHSFLDALGETYSSIFLSGKLHRVNEALFKYNGMEAWNRAMRVQATSAAVGFLEKHLNTPNKHSERYLSELNLTGDAESYMKDGKLDVDNPEVQAAVVRWVNGAILRPNAAQRPIHASDPHYALLYHLKQFTYSFHKTILTRAAVEAKNGNIAPALSLFTAYVPMMIAADVVKELIVPGDEPAWMKNGLGGIIEHGISRANLFGVPQIGWDAINPKQVFTDTGSAASKAASLFGPTAQELVDWMEVPLTDKHSIGSEILRSLPLSPILTRGSTLVD